jgi:hypothetical protein
MVPELSSSKSLKTYQKKYVNIYRKKSLQYRASIDARKGINTFIISSLASLPVIRGVTISTKSSKVTTAESLH